MFINREAGSLTAEAFVLYSKAGVLACGLFQGTQAGIGVAISATHSIIGVWAGISTVMDYEG